MFGGNVRFGTHFFLNNIFFPFLMECSNTLNHLDFQCLGVRWAYHASFSIYAIFYDGTLKGPSSISSHIATSSVWQHHGATWWLWGNIRWLLRDGISTCSWGQDGETGIGWKILGKIDCLKQIRIHHEFFAHGCPVPPKSAPKRYQPGFVSSGNETGMTLMQNGSSPT